MVVQRFTLPEFNMYIQKLPQKFDKYIGEIQDEAAKTFQRMLKLRINPVSPYSTGNLKKSIFVKKKSKYNYQITAPYYFKYLNLGVGPAYIPIEYLEQHMMNPNVPGVFVNKPRFFVSPETHYNEGVLQKTTDAFSKKYNQIIERGISKALQK